MIRYYEWDYDAQIVTEYARHGQCNKCGECCHWTVHFGAIKPYRARSLRNGSGSTTGRGIWQEINLGRWSYFFCLGNMEPGGECPSFDEETNLCNAHEGTERGKICELWPFSPRCLEHFPQCGYSFSIVEQGPF